MLSQVLLGLRQTTGCVGQQLRRNIGVSSLVMAKAAPNLEPIQKLFHEKLLQYTDKSKKAGGGLVESTPEMENQLKDELAKIDRIYGGGQGVDMTAFPTFTFSDPTLERVDIGLNRAEALKEMASSKKESEVKEAEDLSDTPWFTIH